LHGFNNSDITSINISGNAPKSHVELTGFCNIQNLFVLNIAGNADSCVELNGLDPKTVKNVNINNNGKVKVCGFNRVKCLISLILTNNTNLYIHGFENVSHIQAMIITANNNDYYIKAFNGYGNGAILAVNICINKSNVYLEGFSTFGAIGTFLLNIANESENKVHINAFNHVNNGVDFQTESNVENKHPNCVRILESLEKANNIIVGGYLLTNFDCVKYAHDILFGPPTFIPNLREMMETGPIMNKCIDVFNSLITANRVIIAGDALKKIAGFKCLETLNELSINLIELNSTLDRFCSICNICEVNVMLQPSTAIETFHDLQKYWKFKDIQDHIVCSVIKKVSCK
jgi:hypothetical protein